jgi:hypothetical protein
MAITRVLIDGGAGLNIIFLETLKKMGLDLAGLITPIGIPFYGIIPSKAAMPLGQITLPVMFGTQANYRTEFIQFEVADFEASYHAIIRRPALAIPHYPYLLLKMPGPHGVLSLRGNLKCGFDCDIQAIQIAAKTQAADDREEITTIAAQTNPEELELPIKKSSILSPQKEANVKKIDLGTGDPKKIATISAHLSAKQELALTNFLWDNKDIFAWKPADMPGVPRELVEHRIDVNEDSKPIRQWLRRFSPDKKEAIKKEITKLLASSFIREILHLDWLANPVLVQKKNTAE